MVVRGVVVVVFVVLDVLVTLVSVSVVLDNDVPVKDVLVKVVFDDVVNDLVVNDVEVIVLVVVGSSVVVVVGSNVVVVSSIRSQALAFTSDATKFRSAGHSVFATAVQFPPSLSQPHAATRHSPLFENAWHSTCGYRH